MAMGKVEGHRVSVRHRTSLQSPNSLGLCDAVHQVRCARSDLSEPHCHFFVITKQGG